MVSCIEVKSSEDISVSLAALLSPPCVGEAEARRDAQIKEAIAEEERMASR